MKIVKESIKILKIDWQRIVKNKAALFIIIGLMVIPSMYAWFNIGALWDPYGNASNLPIGIYSDDIGVTIGDEELNIGEGVVDSLRENNELSWQFPQSNEEMIEAVKTGEYYGSIYLPSDFSQKITGIIDGQYQKPTIEYRVNEKINAIAPKMTEAGVEGVEAGISEGFNKVVSDVAFTMLNEAGIELDSRIPLINRVANGLHTVNENQTEINEALNKITGSKDKLNQFQDAVNQLDTTALEAAGDDAVDVIDQVDAKLPELLELQPLITSLEQNSGLITDFESLTGTLNSDVTDLNDKLSTITANIDQSIVVLNEALTIVDKADEYGSDINQMLSDIKQTSTDIGPVIDNISIAADSSIKLINLIVSNIANEATSLSDLVSDNTLSDEELSQISSILTTMAQNITNGQTLIDNMIALLKPLNIINHGQFTTVINNLQAASDSLSTLASKVSNLSQNITSLSTDNIISQLDQISTIANSIVESTAGLSTSDVNSQIQAVLATIAANAASGSQLVTEIGTVDLSAVINATTDNLNIISDYINTIQTQLPEFQKFVTDLDQFMQDNSELMISAIANLDQFWINDLPTITTEVRNIDTYLDNNWSDLKSIIDTSKTTIDTELPKLITVVDKVDDFQQNQWPELSEFIANADEKVTAVTENEQLEKVVDLLVNDIEAGSDFVASPVEVETVRMYPSQNYGSSSSPFYTALCLWVGGLLLTSLVTTGFTPTKDFKPSIRGVYVGRFLTYLSIGIIQTLIVSLGNIFLIGINPVSPVYFVLFALLVDICFMAILYTLASLFGNIGKAVGIFGLVLSISGGGGNFPIQVSSQFFQTLSPFLPFTHAVNLLREAIGGIYPPSVYQAATVLILYTIGFLVVGYIVSRPMKAIFDRFEEKADESHIFH